MADLGLRARRPAGWVRWVRAGLVMPFVVAAVWLWVSLEDGRIDAWELVAGALLVGLSVAAPAAFRRR